MNKKENLKALIIECCINGTMTIKVAVDRLDFSERYVKKLKARYKKLGASSMLHGNCGKQPKHTIDAKTKEILHKKKVEICISKRIGMKVRFNDKWYKITPICIKKVMEAISASITFYFIFYISSSSVNEISQASFKSLLSDSKLFVSPS